MTESTAAPVSSNKPARLASIDVYRGMVMFLMLAEIMHFFDLAVYFPGYRILEWLRFHTTHVQWEGCSLHDLIQPSFTFLVGVAMPFSIASRLKREQSKFWMIAHAAWRAFALISLGIILRSLDSEQTNFRFDDTLTQIGLGYFFVFLIALLPKWTHYASAFGILLLFWAAFAFTSPPPADFDYPAVGVPEDWPHHSEGLASHWNKNSNLSWRSDVWFMNLFPREQRFEFSSGGYCTLSFVPTAVTMLFGLIAGVWLRDPDLKPHLIRNLAVAGALGILTGWGIAALGLCPLVKRIWTPTWTLYSGGCCMLWLLGLHLICDVKKWTRWSFPFMVIGANSILIYVMSWTVTEPIREMLLRHFGPVLLAVADEKIAKLLTGGMTLVIMYYVLLWLYRRRAFVKI